MAGNINTSGSFLYKGNPVLQVPGGAIAFNTALGLGALASDVPNISNSTGFDNTATGANALFFNTSGAYNTATGGYALFNNTTGYSNTASGFGALYSNTGACRNTATGSDALWRNTTGAFNTATGFDALFFNTTGGANTATGYFVLLNNTGGSNTAMGYAALDINNTGSNNIGVGYEAAHNVAGGNSNNIHIGTLGASGDSNTIRIGGGTSGISDTASQTAFFASGILGTTTGQNNAVPVVIDSNGQLGTVSSSRRYKEDIQDMGEASAGLMKLRPVTFRYKKAFTDGSKPIQYGLIAEEVAEVYPDLVAHSADGQIETVKYQVLDFMLLNEVQHQEREIRGLENQLTQERNQNKALQERLARLEAVMERMMTAPAP